MTIAVRITLASGNVDFYEDEIIDVRRFPVKDIDYKINDDALPTLENKGDVWNTIEIDFLEFYKTTKAKIQSIIDEKTTMTVYYCYQYNSATNVTAFLIPDVNEFHFFAGEETALNQHTLLFRECS